MIKIEKPFLSNDQVVLLVKDLYGYEVESIIELDSYDDCNFLITTRDEEAPGNRFILKIFNSLESKVPGRYKSMCETLEVLHKNGFTVPKPVATRNGDFTTSRQLGNVSPNVIALLTYLPGTTMDHVTPSEEHFCELLKSSAKLVAKMDRFMLRMPYFPWKTVSDWYTPENVTFENLSSCLDVIDDATLRETCVAVVTRVERELHPRLNQLRSGLIHCDINPGNIIITEKPIDSNSPADHSYAVTGFIDFAEMKKGKLVFELATMLSPCLRRAHVLGFRLSAKVAQNILEAYESELPLLDAERDCLFVSVLANLVNYLCFLNKKNRCFPAQATAYDFANLKAAASVLKTLTAAGSFQGLN